MCVVRPPLEDKEVAEFLIKKGANDWNNGLMRACWSGQTKLVGLMIQHGATNLNFCLKISSSCDYKEIVRTLILAGATE